MIRCGDDGTTLGGNIFVTSVYIKPFRYTCASTFLTIILFTYGCGSGSNTTITNVAPVNAPTNVSLSVDGPRSLRFDWDFVSCAHHFAICEDKNASSAFLDLEGAAQITALSHLVEISVHRTLWGTTQYAVDACSQDRTARLRSTPITLPAPLCTAAVGYFKASNTGSGDYFGRSISMSHDGNTIAVGAYGEDSSATVINGDDSNNGSIDSGAVYVFRSTTLGWTQEAYIKAFNTGSSDNFGSSVSLSADGNTLAVGAPFEDSNATDIDGDETNNSASDSGAVYIFTRTGSTWTQQAYVKASNTEELDNFGTSVSLSSDGNTMAAGAPYEDSNATDIDGDETNNLANDSGAVYIFTRAGTTWTKQAYVKASNCEASDRFGAVVALAEEGSTLAVAATAEDSSATGIDGDQSDNSAAGSGAAYIFTRSGSTWSQEAYIKASNTRINDGFGYAIALSSDGNTFAVGAPWEDCASTGIDGNQSDFSAGAAGALYLYSRSNTTWSQQAYIKASNTQANDGFGTSVAICSDGSTLAVGAFWEDSNATGVGGSQTNDSAAGSGALYLFKRASNSWSQEVYVKASNTQGGDRFSSSIALSSDGNKMAVSAESERSNAIGIGGNQADNSAAQSGALYLY